MAYCEPHYKKLFGDPCFYCCQSTHNAAEVRLNLVSNYARHFNGIIVSILFKTSDSEFYLDSKFRV